MTGRKPSPDRFAAYAYALRELLIAGLSPADDGLGAAWAVAEAALPEGWGIGIHPRSDRYDAGASVDGEWAVMASGPTPSAALLALAAALRESVTA